MRCLVDSLMRTPFPAFDLASSSTASTPYRTGLAAASWSRLAPRFLSAKTHIYIYLELSKDIIDFCRTAARCMSERGINYRRENGVRFFRRDQVCPGCKDLGES
jgi:hypothetical protein